MERSRLYLAKLKAVEKRGAQCESCGAVLPVYALEFHHMLIHRQKGVPELDCEENCMLVCNRCHHLPDALSYDEKCKFWKKQVERGYNMYEWLSSLPLKIKPRFE